MSRTLQALIIEDSALDVALLVRELRGGGFEVKYQQVETAEALKGALAGCEWNVVFCDFTLPCFSGKLALTIIQESGLDLPFIYVSGTIGEDTAVEAMKAGAHDYVMKNNLKRLVPAVERELRCAQERRERRLAEEALRSSEHKYRAVFENLGDAAFVIDEATGEILETNAQAEALLQRSRQEILAMNQTQLYPPLAADGPPPLRPGAVAGQNPAGCDAEVLRKDGVIVPVHLSVSQMVLSGRRLRLALFRDITERKSLEAEARQAQKMEAVGQLASGVAHDFNNLLAVIRGNADLLLMSAGEHSPQTRESLHQIASAAERAANLTRQLLVFSRKQVMQSQPLLLNELVTNLTKMLKRVIREDICLECRYAEPLPFVRADPGMMEQVLLNLVVNARDAMPRGGQLLITTERVLLDEAGAQVNPEARSGEFVCLSVSDTGTGIAPELMPRIFELFFTTKEPGKGTGLGLATVYRIVKQHQGWVEVSSRVGLGTTFKLFVPAIAPPAKARAAPPAEAGLCGGSETILLVEDDSALRAILRQVLEVYRYKVYEATCARHAREVWSQRAGGIDLLLTDIVMPEGVTGRDLAEQLRAERPMLKVILMSGYSAEVVGTNAEFLRRTKYLFLQKPSSTDILVRTVRQCLDDKEATAMEE